MWNGQKLSVSLITEFCPWIKLFRNSSAHAVVRSWLGHFFPLSLHGFHTEAKQAQAQAKHKHFNPYETYFITFAVAFISVTQHSRTFVCAAFFILVLQVKSRLDSASWVAIGKRSATEHGLCTR